MKYQPLLENVPSLENIIEYNDLSMRDLADMMKDDGFQINSKNNRTNQNKAHAMRNEHMRRNQEHENIPASVLQSHSLACPQQSIPGSQTTVGVNTGTTCQNTETMGSAIGLSCQLGDVQLEPAPGERTRHDPRWQAMAGVQPARATVQMVCEHIRDDSTFTVSHERMAPRNQIRMNANVLPSKTYREGKSPTDSTFLLPQYPGMTQINQISGEDIPGPGVQSTTAPANPQEMHLPRHEIPEATSTPPDTPHTEAGPSSHDTEPVGHTQQLSDHLMEPEPAHDGAVPILNMHIRSTTRICTIPESSTSITRLSTEQEINMLGSGLCGPVSQAKQRLEKTDARGLHMAHDEVETLVRNMLVPGGRVGASPLPGRDGEFGLLRDIEKFGGHGLLDRAQVGSVNDELEAAYTQLKVSCFLRHSGFIVTSSNIIDIG
ncbi:hypothetical protein PR048_018016 [Dryococelus australis]|uniref:Uncharacterized protein n=1 Tax=Dryococelus australis TaxID=614101 RepID=A0ABQ9HB85_9NEOP|nr:hypothetical protein PR048_018016 [Dryococelus australis]